MSLTKEECEKALYEISLITAKNTEDGSCVGCSCTSCLPNDECFNGNLIGVFNRLIKEHFELVDKYNGLEEKYMKLLLQWGKSDNPPLKFEELKSDMWVWDNKLKAWFLIKAIKPQSYWNIVIYANYLTDVFEEIKFEENRFYRKQV